MPHQLKQLLAKNRAWAEKLVAQDPQFFKRLVEQQQPQYLWIGCSDSRVPANQVVGMAPGELFVHRNVANQVIQTDFNCLSVIQYAIQLLKVKHILVVGHYGCGGVKAAIESKSHGLVDHWLYPIRDIYHRHKAELEQLDEHARIDRMCELNVIEQVKNLAKTNMVQEAWRIGQPLHIHGWVYSLDDGLVSDMQVSISDSADVEQIYHFGTD
ncbi:carbonate dehydratase [Idiomarina xiamenensis]|uniref:Carbonic anhydrase n=1 Tax=Idiomarina xiamenensis 10-D-4 TaxID=740709 RepID=K2JWK8_9GAMM|nr:carbonate dehydratase [Idiomarina xiamenensis]EKE79893.1 carbonic anhydrase [Idiomarina xiamenensis 10-D-4]